MIPSGVKVFLASHSVDFRKGTLIETCKMNDVDPQAWLADVLARLPDHPVNRVADLLPWNRGIGRRPDSPKRLPPERHG
jgi:hypothetical protein